MVEPIVFKLPALEVIFMAVAERIRALYARDAAAKSAFDFLRGYQRNRSETTVSVLRWQAGLDEDAVKNLFSELENIGLGEYVPGRHGHPCRFRWALPVKVVAAVAVGASDEPLEVEAPAAPAAVAAGGVGGPGAAAVIRHPYTLRPDFVVTIVLPPNLTPVEATRLADFIRTLPFSGAASSAVAA
jgi:hypothetical protein